MVFQKQSYPYYQARSLFREAELALILNFDFFPLKIRPRDVIWKLTIESVGSWKQLQIAKWNSNFVLVYVDPTFPSFRLLQKSK